MRRERERKREEEVDRALKSSQGTKEETQTKEMGGRNTRTYKKLSKKTGEQHGRQVLEDWKG